jgi:hypothetical protein
MLDKKRIDGEVYDKGIEKIFANEHKNKSVIIEATISDELLRFCLESIGEKFGKDILGQVNSLSSEDEVHFKLQNIISREHNIPKKNKLSKEYSNLLSRLSDYNKMLRDFLSSPLNRNNRKFTNQKIGRLARTFLKKKNYLKSKKNFAFYYPATLKSSEIRKRLNLNSALPRTISKKELENSLSRLVTKGILKKLSETNGYYQYISEEKETNYITSLNEEYQIKELKNYLRNFSKKEDYKGLFSAWNMIFFGIDKNEFELFNSKDKEEFVRIAWKVADYHSALNKLIMNARKEKEPREIKIFLG